MTDNRAVTAKKVTKEEFLEFVNGLEYNYRKKYKHLEKYNPRPRTAAMIYMEFGLLVEPFSETDVLQYLRIKDGILKFAKKEKLRNISFSYHTKEGAKVFISDNEK